VNSTPLIFIYHTLPLDILRFYQAPIKAILTVSLFQVEEFFEHFRFLSELIEVI
jgi:hypothetical protein